MGRFLAIDFGEKRVGLALSDPTKIIAKPFKSIIYTDHDDLLNKISLIVKEKNIEKIIITKILNILFFINLFIFYNFT